MKKRMKRLVLTKETLHKLSLAQVKGGDETDYRDTCMFLGGGPSCMIIDEPDSVGTRC